MYNVDAGNGKPEAGMSLFKAAVLLFSLLVGLLVLAFGADWLLRTDNFPVRHVRFEGEFRHVTQQELESIVMNTVHGNFFLLNLDAVKARVESLPWVYRASVRRQWPQDIHVRFTEQRLAARWGDGAFLNQAGDVVPVTGQDFPAELPRLEGPEGTGPQVLEHSKNFSQIMAAVGLQLERIMLTPRRTWRLTLANDMEIVLDQENPAQKLERFARVYAKSLTHLGSEIKRVDLRYSNGFAIDLAGDHGAGISGSPGYTGTLGTQRSETSDKG